MVLPEPRKPVMIVIGTGAIVAVQEVVDVCSLRNLEFREIVIREFGEKLIAALTFPAPCRVGHCVFYTLCHAYLTIINCQVVAKFPR